MLKKALFTPTIDPDVALWATVVATSGGAVGRTRLRDVSRLVKNLKSCGAWGLRDDYAVYAGAENATQALVTLKRRLTQVANNSPTLGATGYTGNNTTAFINTLWNPASGTWQYVQNSAAYGCWIATDPGVAATKRIMGNDDDNASEMLFGTIGQLNGGINTATLIQTTPSNRLGMIEVVRTASNAQQLFQNTASLGTGSQVSIAIANRSFSVLAANASGGPVGSTNSTISMAFIGAPLATAVQAAEYAAWRSFLNLYGVP